MPGGYAEKRAILDVFGVAALGYAVEYKTVGKFGAAPDGIQTSATDIWDRADATPTQQIWVAPTQARVHAIVSSSAADASGGTGALQVRVYGLTSWSTKEVTETVTLTGQTPVNTANSYVIIHRMQAIAQATTTSVGCNAGTITATAATDATVTAAILPGNGQTEMAIYGVPSVQTALMYRWSAQIDRTVAAGATVDFRVRVNENPNVQRLAFLRKDDISLQTGATTAYQQLYVTPRKYPGPCIIKVQGIASANDIDAEAQFDLLLVDN